MAFEQLNNKGITKTAGVLRYYRDYRVPGCSTSAPNTVNVFGMSTGNRLVVPPFSQEGLNSSGECIFALSSLNARLSCCRRVPTYSMAGHVAKNKK